MQVCIYLYTGTYPPPTTHSIFLIQMEVGLGIRYTISHYPLTIRCPENTYASAYNVAVKVSLGRQIWKMLPWVVTAARRGVQPDTTYTKSSAILYIKRRTRHLTTPNPILSSLNYIYSYLRYLAITDTL